MARRVRDVMVQQVLFPARPKEIATMKSSTKDQVAGKIHELKGKVKETAGKVTDNPCIESAGNRPEFPKWEISGLIRIMTNSPKEEELCSIKSFSQSTVPAAP